MSRRAPTFWGPVGCVAAAGTVMLSVTVGITKAQRWFADQTEITQPGYEAVRLWVDDPNDTTGFMRYQVKCVLERGRGISRAEFDKLYQLREEHFRPTPDRRAELEEHVLKKKEQ